MPTTETLPIICASGWSPIQLLEFPYLPIKVIVFTMQEEVHSPFFCDIQWGNPYAMSCVPAGGVLVATTTFYCSYSSDESGCREALTSLQGVVRAIAESHPIPIDPDLDELLTRAAALRGAPSDDIEAWARHLAEDVGDLTD